MKNKSSYSLAELCKMPRPKAIVKKVIPGSSDILFTGPERGGKSLVAMDIAFHVAFGLDNWCDCPIRDKRGVLYINGKGEEYFNKHLLAFKENHNLSLNDAKLKMVPSIDICAKSKKKGTEAPGVLKLIETIDAFKQEFSEFPSLVVVDSLHDCNVGDKDTLFTGLHNLRDLRYNYTDYTKPEEMITFIFLVHSGSPSQSKQEEDNHRMHCSIDLSWYCLSKDGVIVFENNPKSGKGKRRDLVQGPEKFTFEYTKSCLHLLDKYTPSETQEA